MSMYSERGGHCTLLTHSVCTGLHDAVEKGYLETMTFGLCRDKEQTDLVEQFQYKFAYESDIVTMADSFGTGRSHSSLTVLSGLPSLRVHHQHLAEGVAKKFIAGTTHSCASPSYAGTKWAQMLLLAWNMDSV